MTFRSNHFSANCVLFNSKIFKSSPWQQSSAPGWFHWNELGCLCFSNLKRNFTKYVHNKWNNNHSPLYSSDKRALGWAWMGPRSFFTLFSRRGEGISVLPQYSNSFIPSVLHLIIIHGDNLLPLWVFLRCVVAGSSGLGSPSKRIWKAREGTEILAA